MPDGQSKIVEYCINLNTGNVKPWNKEMDGRTHITKCTKDGVPIPRATNYKTGPSRLDRKEETEKVESIKDSENSEDSEEDNGIDFVTDTVHKVEIESVKFKEPKLSKPLPEPSDVSLTVDTLMEMKKPELIEMAKSNGLKFSNSDIVKQNKEWFAKEIIKQYEIK